MFHELNNKTMILHTFCPILGSKFEFSKKYQFIDIPEGTRPPKPDSKKYAGGEAFFTRSTTMLVLQNPLIARPFQRKAFPQKFNDGK